MINDLYTNIDEREDYAYYLYKLYSNGMSFKKIEHKNIFLNQKKLTPFYMWNHSGNLSSSAYTPSYDQFKFFTSTSINFSKLDYDNKNKTNQKIFAQSASMGYALAYNTLMLDRDHNNVLYYYGYANYYGSGSPFNQTQSSATADIPAESKALSPSKIAYKTIKNILSEPQFIENEFIQISESFNTTEFIYIKVPRRVYHEELLNGSFELCLQSQIPGRRVFLVDPSQYNSEYRENNISYIVSGTSKDNISYISGNYDVYGILDRKNALAILDVDKLKSVFGAAYFTVPVTNRFTSSINSYTHVTYEDFYGFKYASASVSTQYTASYYPIMDAVSKLFYSGSLIKNMAAIGLETQIVDEYYIKIGSNEFNCSTNPTYLNGDKIKNQFMENPITYITTIGLYNDYNDCLAIAKLSKPLKKDFETAYKIKIQLKQ